MQASIAFLKPENNSRSEGFRPVFEFVDEVEDDDDVLKNKNE